MALGTPVSRGDPGRGSGTGDITGDTFTPAADSLLVLGVFCVASSSSEPDTVTGHDGSTTWAQIGTTIQVSTNHGLSIWAAHVGSSPSSGAVAVQRATGGAMRAHIVEITGADVSGTLANSFVQTDSNMDYGTAASLTLSGATKTTMHWWSSQNVPTITVENTLLDTGISYIRMSNDYASGGDSTPTATISANQNWGAFGVEVKEAGGAPSTNPKGPFSHPLFGPFRGPIS